MSAFFNKKRISVIFMMLVDLLIIIAFILLGNLIRFDFSWNSIPEGIKFNMPLVILVYSIVSFVLYLVFGLYKVVWRYIGVYDSIKIFISTTISAILSFLVIRLLRIPFSSSAFLIAFVFVLLATLFAHISFRLYLFVRRRLHTSRQEKNIMIIGAGSAGRMLFKEFASDHHLRAKVCCFIDDNKNLVGKSIDGVPIFGNRDSITTAAKKFDISTIIFAIPAASMKDRTEILNICKKTQCELKTLPGIYQLVTGEVTVDKLRKVNIEDLLGRETIDTNIDEIADYVNNKVVLVTGGGGSIGSELCRQIAHNGPRRLIIVDIYENNAYDIQIELKRKYPQLELEVLIASVRDTQKINQIFHDYKPSIVFHAAAHKHVPLMETSPIEAIKNNVFGTLNVCEACNKFSVSKLVLISSDKAVNPTNIMGTTKRLCEMIIQMYDQNSQTSFVAVRFGNVLGSNGSVIPLFTKQIAEGGPVTVTDKRIIRYFMTITEAVSLVLQAGAFAKGGEIFVLDMGTPVSIDEMARNLIQLSGLKPDEDIKIVYTGLRPGEKLYEELLMDEEGLDSTTNSRIFIGKPIKIDKDALVEQLEDLKRLSLVNSPESLDLLSKMVPTYHKETN